MKIGIISANWGIAAHLPAWRAIDGVEVVAICTSRRETAEAAASSAGIPRAYWDYRDMADAVDIDIVDVGTRPDLREPMVIAAFEGGKHVFAGAVFASTLERARGVAERGFASNRHCALDTTILWTDAALTAKSLIAAGYIGEPASVSLRWHNSLFSGSGAIGQHWRWFGKPEHGASALRNLGTHAFHCLIDLFGPIQSLTAQTQIILKEWRFGENDVERPGVPDAAQLLMRFASGVQADADLCWSAQAADLGFRLEITGTKGVLVAIDTSPFPTSGSLRLFGARGAASLTPISVGNPPGIPDIVHLREAPARPIVTDIARCMAGLVQAVETGGTPRPDLRAILHVEEILAAAARANDTHKWIDLAPIDAHQTRLNHAGSAIPVSH